MDARPSICSGRTVGRRRQNNIDTALASDNLPFAHLRPHLPGVEVPLLLGGQRIDPDSHACELEDCDPLVNLDGHPVNLVGERRGVLHHVLGAEGLVRAPFDTSGQALRLCERKNCYFKTRSTPCSKAVRGLCGSHPPKDRGLFSCGRHASAIPGSPPDLGHRGFSLRAHLAARD